MKLLKKAMSLTQEICIKPKLKEIVDSTDKHKDSFQHTFVTTFSQEHQEMKNILLKH